MKKIYVKPVITFIELPKNNFIATSGFRASGDMDSEEGGPGVDDDEWDGWFN